LHLQNKTLSNFIYLQKVKRKRYNNLRPKSLKTIQYSCWWSCW